MKRVMWLAGLLLLAGCQKDDPGAAAQGAAQQFFSDLTQGKPEQAVDRLAGRDSSLLTQALDGGDTGRVLREVWTHMGVTLAAPQAVPEGYTVPAVLEVPDVKAAQGGVQSVDGLVAALGRVPTRERRLNVLVREAGGAWQVVDTPELEAALSGLDDPDAGLIPDFSMRRFVPRMEALLAGDLQGGAVQVIPSDDPELRDRYAQTDEIISDQGRLSLRYRLDDLAGEHLLTVTRFTGQLSDVAGGEVRELTLTPPVDGTRAWCVESGPFQGSTLVIGPDDTGVTPRVELMTPRWQQRFSEVTASCAPETAPAGDAAAPTPPAPDADVPPALPETPRP